MSNEKLLGCVTKAMNKCIATINEHGHHIFGEAKIHDTECHGGASIYGSEILMSLVQTYCEAAQDQNMPVIDSLFSIYAITTKDDEGNWYGKGTEHMWFLYVNQYTGSYALLEFTDQGAYIMLQGAK